MRRPISKLLVSCLILLLAGCSQETDNIAPDTTDSITNSSDLAAVDGYYLSYNSTKGIWYGIVGGCTVFFHGPTPSQIKNGMESAWSLAPGAGCNNTYPCTSPSAGYPAGYVVGGDGLSGVSVTFACAAASVVNTQTQQEFYKYTQNIGNESIVVYEKRTVTRTLNSYSAGTCDNVATAKIVIDPSCRPVLVAMTSVTPPRCVPIRIE